MLIKVVIMKLLVVFFCVLKVATMSMNDLPKPKWLNVKAAVSKGAKETLVVVKRNTTRTVCEEALCPNIGECWREKTAAFLIMGEVCTRRCAFCNIAHGCPAKLDSLEPMNIAKSISELGIKYAVITSVTRDDLSDQGAGHFAEVVVAIRQNCPQTKIEILTPDFQGKNEAVEMIMSDAKPDVFAHNIEIVKRLHPIVKKLPSAYKTSMLFLKNIKKKYPKMVVKTGLIVGVGETDDEIFETLDELASFNLDILTIGQYLAPSSAHFSVARYVTPEQFATYKSIGEILGIKRVVSGPLVRSSYKAQETFNSL